MTNNFISENQELQAAIRVIAETAGYMWQKGWAERNGGNISVNLTPLLAENLVEFPAHVGIVELAVPCPLLAGNLFYVTGSGSRMRDVANDPVLHGCILRIRPDGFRCDVMALEGVVPTSELPSHLAIHQFLSSRGNGYMAVLHTHPTELVALTHCQPFLEAGHLNRILWSMIPEALLFVPKGASVIPFELPGSIALAKATISQLVNHDVVLWEKHGALAVGRSVDECFDTIDVLNKSARIWIDARCAGYVPEGLSDAQMDQLRGV